MSYTVKEIQGKSFWIGNGVMESITKPELLVELAEFFMQMKDILHDSAFDISEEFGYHCRIGFGHGIENQILGCHEIHEDTKTDSMIRTVRMTHLSVFMKPDCQQVLEDEALEPSNSFLGVILRKRLPRRRIEAH